MAKTETELENLIINYFPSREVYEENKAQLGANELAIVPQQSLVISKDADGYYIEE